MSGSSAPRSALRAAALGAFVLVSAGCSGTPAERPGQSASAPASLTSTERLADDLAEASLAYDNGDLSELTVRLRAIELAGAQPSDEPGQAALVAWRGVVPPGDIPLRGRVLGPAYLTGTLAAGAKIDTEQLLMGGQSVSIAAGTAPRKGLRLRVLRGDGKMVCEQTPAHARECRFVPSYTQRYRIVLQNTGTGEARYHIVFD